MDLEKINWLVVGIVTLTNLLFCALVFESPLKKRWESQIPNEYYEGDVVEWYFSYAWFGFALAVFIQPLVANPGRIGRFNPFMVLGFLLWSVIHLFASPKKNRLRQFRFSIRFF